MNAPDQIHIDFDEWSKLAKDNPEAFEQKRQAVLASTIASAPACRRQRLRGLQWRIDQTRLKAGNPLGACVAISRMMLDSMYGNNGLVENIASLTNPNIEPAQRPNARLLAFRRAKH